MMQDGPIPFDGCKADDLVTALMAKLEQTTTFKALVPGYEPEWLGDLPPMGEDVLLRVIRRDRFGKESERVLIAQRVQNEDHPTDPSEWFWWDEDRDIVLDPPNFHPKAWSRIPR